MEAEKFKIPVQKGMQSLEGIIRFTYLCKMIGKSTGLIHEKTHGFELKFKQKDVDMINSALQEIGNRLLYSVISKEPSHDPRSYAVGETVVEQIRALGKVVCMPYIYRDRMGKTIVWFKNRQNKDTTNQYNDEDIMTINMIVREIAYKLLSIELIL